VHYDNSNQIFLENTMKKLMVSTKIIPHLPPGKSVSIHSVEYNLSMDDKLRNMVEDYITNDLLKSEILVFERDDDLINYFVRENESFSLLNDSTSLQEFHKSHLKSSDYILAYRILECGVRTTPVNRKKLYREALIRLHIRLIETKSGQIKHIQNIAALKNDEVTNHMNTYYENFHYNIFDYVFPLNRKKEN
jgi:hypothetical protein